MKSIKYFASALCRPFIVSRSIFKTPAAHAQQSTEITDLKWNQLSIISMKNEDISIFKIAMDHGSYN
jgi:hypothetical protein